MFHFGKGWQVSQILRSTLLNDLGQASVRQLATRIGFTDVKHLKRALAGTVEPSKTLLTALQLSYQACPLSYFVTKTDHSSKAA